MSKIPMFFDGNVLTMILEGKSVCISKDDERFKAVRDALVDGSESQLLSLLAPVYKDKLLAPDVFSLKDGSIAFGNGFSYGHGVLTCHGETLTNPGVVNAIERLLAERLPLDGIANFVDRLYDSTRSRVRQQLLLFADAKGLTIDSQGFIIAYKAVDCNYRDKWTGKIDNSPGATPSMDPGEVEDNPDVACGPGLHAGSLDYIYGYGSGTDHIIIVKIDPADVISIPTDSGCQKMRTCGYTVVGDYNGELKQVVYAADAGCAEYYDDDEDEDDDDDFDYKGMYKDNDEDEEEDEDAGLYGYHNKRDSRGRFVP